jgi:shikimate kinase
MKNIVLIGMPGSGKSTLGVLLAKSLGFSFVDTDLIISRRAKMPLQKILNKDGLDSFLALEEAVGAELECESTVIATGGSMVLSDKAMQNLKKDSRVVYIDVPLNEIKRRVTNIKTRGIAFRKGDTLDDVYRNRVPLYEKYADVTVKFENAADIESTVDKMVEAVKN